MSQYRGPVADWTFIAGEDLRNYRYCIVKLTATNDEVKLAETAGANVPVIGILQNAPNSGEQALVRIFGGSKLYIDGNSVDVAPGDGLVATTGGIGVKNTNDKYKIVGVAMHPETATTSHLVEVFVNPTFQSV